MKKFLSLMLAVIMLSTCMGTAVFAADVNVNISANSFYDLIDLLDRNMPDGYSPADGREKRVEIFSILSLYMKTDSGMDTLIGLVEDLTDAGYVVPSELPGAATLQKIADSLAPTLVANRDEILFMLDVIRALPESKREAALDDFVDAQQAVEDKSVELGRFWATELEAGVVLNSVNQTSLNRVFAAFVGNEGQADEKGQEELATHGIGPNIILRLFKAFQGSIKLTDYRAGSSNFAIKEYSEDFASRLLTSLGAHFDSVNSSPISGSRALLGSLVSVLDGFDSDLKYDIKKVLGASGIDLYVPLEEEKSNTGSSGNKTNRPSKKDEVVIGEIVPDLSGEPSNPPVADGNYVYYDTVDHWAKDYIAELTKRGIFNGYGDGTFRPDMGVTREEISVALTRALKLESESKRVPSYTFADSSFISLWAVDSVDMMVHRDIFKGYDDGEFKPKRVITREEMVAVIIRMFTDNIPVQELTYTDAAEIGPWAVEYIKKASSMSIVAGYPDGTFRPANNITRAEAAKILYNFLFYAGLL